MNQKSTNTTAKITTTAIDGTGIFETTDFNEARSVWTKITMERRSGLARSVGGRYFIFSPASMAHGHFTGSDQPPR